MPKILLVDDDKDLTLVVSEWLESQNYILDVAFDGKQGYEFLRQGHYEVAIIDWDLPGMNGVELCRKYRAARGVTPILMLTGKGQIADKEEGLDSGADDYLTKPFSMRELSARLRALVRRPATAFGTLLQCGDLEMDPDKHILRKNGAEVHLLPKDFAFLEFLMRHPGEIFSTEALLHRVWSLDSEATSDAVRTAVKRLRKLLDESDDESESIIENVRRVGYRLKPKR